MINIFKQFKWSDSHQMPIGEEKKQREGGRSKEQVRRKSQLERSASLSNLQLTWIQETPSCHA
jgi:hypothetical protein